MSGKFSEKFSAPVECLAEARYSITYYCLVVAANMHHLVLLDLSRETFLMKFLLYDCSEIF